jgi:hypothetical protein
MKEIKFSDFRKTDPVLKSFTNLEEEPYVPQRHCPINNINGAAVGIRIE